MNREHRAHRKRWSFCPLLFRPTRHCLVEENRTIENLPHVRYIIREKNVGRSAIRNFLVSQAKGDRLLFIDGDLSLNNPSFIRNYLQTEGDVVVGGILGSCLFVRTTLP